jgi:hypothetical protein
LTGPAEGELELKGTDGLLNTIIKPGETSFAGGKEGGVFLGLKKR